MGMGEESRHGIRRGAVELTRRQWLSVAIVLVVGVATALVLLVAISMGAGGIALGVTAVVSALIIGFGRHPQPGQD
jgi:hypothetical protein